MEWSQVALVFPGQGSQQIGMGKDFFDTFPHAQSTFLQADSVLGYALSDLMFSGEESTLAQTIHTQPAMFVSSIAIWRVLTDHLPQAKPALLAGHSLGEITAVCASGALGFEAGVALVQQRAQLMQQAGEANPGGMSAILNLDPERLAQVCEQATAQVGKPVVPANDNTIGQIVISGDNEALEVAMQLAKEAGAKRALRLNVSTANHSPLMASAEQAFAQVIAKTPFSPPQTPIIANLTAQPLTTAEAIQAELSQQLTRQVRWTQSIQAMIAQGVTTFIEVGSKEVLSGLIKRVDGTVTTLNINSTATLEHFLGTVK